MFAFGLWLRVSFFRCFVRNLVFPVRRCSELEFWRGPARSTLQFSRTALHRSGRSAYFSCFGGVRFATFGQSPCPRPGPGLGSAPRATPVSDVSMGIAQRSRTEPLQNSRNKPIFHFDGAPFSKTGELRPPDPSRTRVLSTSGPEKRGFAREPQKKPRGAIGQRRTRVLLRLN